MDRCQKKHLERTYEVTNWNNATEFLEALARKGGRLLKGGEADLDGVAKMFLNDFLRGKVPWFTPPPNLTNAAEGNVAEGRDGKLGEMSRKRKRGEAEVVDMPAQSSDAVEDEFEGFDDEVVEEGDLEDDEESLEDKNQDDEAKEAPDKELDLEEGGGVRLISPG
ncbi:hypothetical protein LTS18_014726 [Coniosporium uncinatum]|uniref:Uncharacterized protein n=1 Tax=Coniosporium uncinatum TaxID=93489 RepID=A0ACC3DGY2_9PEZI|nr:hypothetical protein LTS18_014726 [Coniosporium uncinatum]